MRAKLIERLGPEAIDPITEFLNLALTFDEGEPPSLTGFLSWLRVGRREVKRDMEHGRDEVRVLTVHGSKGLEAPIVFLPDTCSGGAARRQGELVGLTRESGAGLPAAWAWPVKGAAKLAAIEGGRLAASASETEERNRLLYVAMTRARDRLYVAGYQGTKARDPSCWYDLIVDGLGDRLGKATDHDGQPVRRLEVGQHVAAQPPRHLDIAAPEPVAPPMWSMTPAPREPQLSIPLAPSRLAPYDIDEDETGEPPRYHVDGVDRPAPIPSFSSANDEATREPATPSPLKMAGEFRFLRGTLTHALLEHLPTLERSSWQRAAQGFVDTRGAALPARTRASIVDETLAVLADPAFAAVFGPDSRAEVPIVAEIPPPDGRGPPLRLNGQVDRLALVEGAVLIIDYKTNRPPPLDVTGIASAYVYQLSAYVLALQRIYPGRTVRAAILWTDGPRLMEIPEEMLATHSQKVWSLAS